MTDLIPVVNVDEEQLRVLAEALEPATAVINGDEGYILIGVGKTVDGAAELKVVAALDDNDLYAAACGLMGMLGVAAMGPEAAAALPAEIQQSVLLAAGLRAFHQRVVATHQPVQSEAPAVH